MYTVYNINYITLHYIVALLSIGVFKDQCQGGPSITVPTNHLYPDYRAIAGCCLLWKLINLVILVLEGDRLKFDEMQFAYQARSSTTICSWAVTAVVDHFLRNGAKVFSAAMRS